MNIEDLKLELDSIVNEFSDMIVSAMDLETLTKIKINYLGKKGKIPAMMKYMGQVEDKNLFGQYVNEAKNIITTKIEQVEVTLLEIQINETMKKQYVDVTLPVNKKRVGVQNVLLKTAREIEKVFMDMGYEIAIGQEIESDYHNFEALNLGVDHPARDMQDTFYINPKMLLRTHTSNIQSRCLTQAKDKSFKIICPGKVYRRDDDDATHSHQFMQIEGLVVINKKHDITTSLRELKTTLTIFVNRIFQRDDLVIRMRPSFFPFTEPSVEVDVTCSRCLGAGCGFCKQTGWIEVLGSGIIHKNVLSNAGYDCEKYSGFAFGIGVERIALLKYNIEDIRNLYVNDFRFLKQFKR